MFRLLLLFFFLFSITQCSTLADRPNDPVFTELSDQFMQDYWQLHPEKASEFGLSKYDSQLSILDGELIKKRIEFYKSSLVKINKVPENMLSIRQIMDRSILVNQLEKAIWFYEVYKNHEWDPAFYNIGENVSYVLEKQHRPLADRLKDLSAKLLKVNQYYQAAKNNIKNPTKEHINLAIDQNRGLERYLINEVLPMVKGSALSRQEKSTLEQRLQASKTAARRYRTFLSGILSRPQSVGGLRSFRIGKDKYAQFFAFEMQIDSSPKELYKSALVAKEDIRSKIFETAIGLYPKYFGEKLPPKDRDEVVNGVMKKIIKKNPATTDFIESVRKQIPELVTFVNSKGLLALDPKKPLIVRPTPLYQRGAAGISIDPPSFYDKTAATFYNVTPLSTLTAKQRKSFLREYNPYTLQILNIHEAIPGHYAQLVYNNKSKSLINAVFWNHPLIEGWASYAERMMLEEGYGDNSQELWLMYYKWHLRAITNTILDYEIHVKNLSKKDAMKMMMVDAYQEKSEAEGKWSRAQVTQVQLATYFAGFEAIYKLRETIKEDQDEDFSLKDFHEKFLSYGSAPIREIKKAMLE